MRAYKEGPGQIKQCAGRLVCPRPGATLLLLVLAHIYYLRRTTAYTTTPEPRSRAAAGKSSADGANAPPLLGSGAVDSSSVVRSTTTSVSVCAMAVGMRISIATRAAVASKTSFFTRAPSSSLLLISPLPSTPSIERITPSIERIVWLPSLMRVILKSQQDVT